MLLGRDGAEERARGRGESEEQELAEEVEQLADEVAVVGAVVGELLHELERGEAVGALDGPRRPVEELPVDEAEQPRDVFVPHLLAGEGEDLVEER
ncbi:MAG: hypothetical protein A2V74_03005 [Acidobacteria bacterium RBG_16_70_10]|nr:MAG: hypothetical protein A2V74_03005 [Acidobacteria bacterium RBG_16_70_10]